MSTSRATTGARQGQFSLLQRQRLHRAGQRGAQLALRHGHAGAAQRGLGGLDAARGGLRLL
ncbi:hypothetical protein ACLESO_50565, partial [Pyxidicoccus sp. 3LG]